MRFKFLFLFLILGIRLNFCYAQAGSGWSMKSTTIDSSSTFKLKKIEIIGNKKTKDYVILRELKSKVGDSLIAGQLYEKLQQSQQLIYNTNLFSEVTLKPVFDTSNEVSIQVHVIERWYIYPTPQFSLTDRNFNEWWKTYDADLDRVIYGLKFTHYNWSGRADQLNVYALNGFSRNYYLNYSNPYSNPALTEGFSMGAGYSQFKEYAYRTNINNRLLFFKKDYFSKENLSIGGTYRIRKGYYKTRFLNLQFNKIRVDDSIATEKYNPLYFNSPKNESAFLDVSFAYQYVNTNNINYPLYGKIFTASISKRGFGWKGGINALSLEANYKKFYPHNHHFYSGIQFNGRLKLPFDQAYINQKAMGYGEYYMRGLEYYVIDGVASGLAKYTLSKKIIDKKIRIPFKIKTIPYIPLKIFGKTYGDMGYVYNKKELDTKLNNRFLYSGGLGVDIISLYDMKLSVEYSWNQLGEKGLFLHARSIL